MQTVLSLFIADSYATSSELPEAQNEVTVSFSPPQKTEEDAGKAIVPYGDNPLLGNFPVLMPLGMRVNILADNVFPVFPFKQKRATPFIQAQEDTSKAIVPYAQNKSLHSIRSHMNASVQAAPLAFSTTVSSTNIKTNRRHTTFITPFSARYRSSLGINSFLAINSYRSGPLWNLFIMERKS